ncbi:nitroreductase family protein [Dacryopinax primogenitus]|uniref:Nitroreductase family protein n=1 Tax=Dacryopinax primogenitus (strain DJM 731) TaxID=1858805 RepID=M5G3R3_DACPD|nr:nitroreductase family protein [Dacryopinax primogenitus]EJU02855.1 nitroreductase family protein [Dacryopinax primogenitus]
MSSASTSTSTPGAAAFLKAVELRRSIYTISNKIPIPDSRVVEIVQAAIKNGPSSYNSQSSRALVLFGDEHKFVWETVLSVLKPIVPEPEFPKTVGKVENCFKAGYGTVLFWEDNTVVKGMQDTFPLYPDRFPVWSQHSSAIVQFIVWTALANEGISASLQHYNPLIDEKLREHFKLPDTWVLVAQMPFGEATAPAGEKTFKPLEDRVKVFGI